MTVNQPNNSNTYFWGAILILLGFLFLLDNFYIIDFGDFVYTYWPIILIAIGAKILLDNRNKAGHKDLASISGAATNVNEERREDPTRISENNVFGDIQIKVDSDSFSGGSLSNVFGDTVLDLSGVKLNQDIIKIRINGVFGDIRVHLPEGAAVNARGNCVAGDISIRGNKKDGLFPNLVYQDDTYSEAQHKIDIQCSVVFGSMNIH
jgi:predicted membrane protein